MYTVFSYGLLSLLFCDPNIQVNPSAAYLLKRKKIENSVISTRVLNVHDSHSNTYAKAAR